MKITGDKMAKPNKDARNSRGVGNKGVDKITPAKTSEEILRVPSGIPGLDELLGGGFVRNSTTLLQGGAGTAKTLFCLQHLYQGATEHDEAGVYISFNESEAALLRHGAQFNWNMRTLKDQKKFLIVCFEPHEIARLINEGGGLIWDTLDSIGAKRVVVDSLSAYSMYFEKPYLANQAILALFEQLNKSKVTALLTMENFVSPTKERGDRAEFLTDGVINMYSFRKKRQHYRALEVLKMRDTKHSTEVKLFGIERSGLRVYRDARFDAESE